MAVEGLLLDVEGVLVADKRYQAVPGAVAFIRRVRELGLPLRLITNNTTDSRSAIVEKLTRVGFDFTAAETHTCTSAAVARLRELRATRCLVLGTANLRQMFADAGFTIVDESEVDAVVVGLDTDLTFERLRLACDAVSRHSAAFIALHRNRLYPDAEGRNAPSVGAIVAAIAYATQVEPTVIGKPSPDYYQQALTDINLPPERVAVVSDDPFSDLAGAKRMGMQAAFVLSGKYADASVIETIPRAEQPDIIVGSIGDLLVDGELRWSD
ncbi:MAG: HAD-IIA family hydrolase [Planctomycetes bacterium]|nr:HAD-IIA family hydrolase [Planctomycetota bacterium]